jgi:hypothetical protein
MLNVPRFCKKLLHYELIKFKFSQVKHREWETDPALLLYASTAME